MNIQPRTIFSFLSINTHETLFTYSPLNILIVHALFAQMQSTSPSVEYPRGFLLCIRKYLRTNVYTEHRLHIKMEKESCTCFLIFCHNYYHLIRIGIHHIFIVNRWKGDVDGKYYHSFAPWGYTLKMLNRIYQRKCPDLHIRTDSSRSHSVSIFFSSHSADDILKDSKYWLLDQ